LVIFFLRWYELYQDELHQNKRIYKTRRGDPGCCQSSQDQGNVLSSNFNDYSSYLSGEEVADEFFLITSWAIESE
jgi:hypothetical protein